MLYLVKYVIIYMNLEYQNLFEGSETSNWNFALFLFIICTRDNITGTSTKTPTVIAKVTPEWTPNKIVDTATASSKKLLAPMKAVGAASG